jgi:DsbC/DsbD-like thiol-disulfide interchange protein
MARACMLAAAATLALAASGPLAPAQAQERGAEAGASPWSPAPKSKARLLNAGALDKGAYRAGVEIALDGRALTYWRNPGDSGVPPDFDFTGSENMARASVAYPAPQRHDEDGAEVFGWRDGVIFPLTVEPKDPSKPVTLDLTLRYAACEKICIPSEGRMRLTLAPAGAQTPQAARIARWAALTPRPASEAGVKFSMEPVTGAASPTWKVRVSPAEAGSDLFAEGDDGWFFDTRAAGADFKLELAERPTGAAAQANVRLTLSRPSGAVELYTTLDAGNRAP